MNGIGFSRQNLRAVWVGGSQPRLFFLFAIGGQDSVAPLSPPRPFPRGEGGGEARPDQATAPGY